MHPIAGVSSSVCENLRASLHTFCRVFQVFVDNFVHGDLHPGNILVHCWGPLHSSTATAGVSGEAQGKTTLTDLWDTVVVSVRPDPCPLQLVLLDAGIVAQLSDHDLANLKAVFTAVVLRQVMAQIYKQIQFCGIAQWIKGLYILLRIKQRFH